MRGSALFLAAVVALLLAPPAWAGCSDSPKPKVDWSGCEKRHLFLSGARLAGADLQKADVSITDLSDAALASANMSGAMMVRTMLSNADLTGARLEKAEGSRALLEGADLTGAVLTKAEFPRASFARAKLVGADLSKTELGRASLAGADLTGASLHFANVARADFRDAILKDVDFDGSYTYLTRFEGVDLSVTKGLVQAQLDLACGDERTKLPSGLAAPETWPCTETD